MIKNLIFDFGKVLVDYDYMLVLDQIFATPDEATAFYHRLMDDGWNERLDRENRTFEQIIGDMQLAMPQWHDEIGLFGARYTEFVTGEMQGMRHLLVRLKAEGYRLYGLTNWSSRVHHTMRQFDIFGLLDGQVISSEEHLVKPERAIYECVCHRFGLVPGECVFADDKSENIEAARAYGMHGVWFRDSAQYERELRDIMAREGGFLHGAADGHLPAELEARVRRAVDNFMQGYGCCQSVVAAFADLYGLDDLLAKRIAAGFGGGVGRMRMMCGAVSGIVALVGLDCGQTAGDDRAGKSACYQVVQDLLAESKRENGSLICAEILGLKGYEKAHPSYEASARTAEYYRTRPCAAKVESAARIFARYLMSQGGTGVWQPGGTDGMR